MMDLTQIEIATAVIFVILQIADVWTTTQALKTGATEGNPVVAWVMDRTGKAWPMVKLALSFGGAYLMWIGGAIWGVWLLSVVIAVVVYSNWQIIKDRKRRGL